MRVVPVGFQPASVAFASDGDGWALGTINCSAGECLAIEHTADGGSTWTSVSAPRTKFSGEGPQQWELPLGSGVGKVACDNSVDCWAYGPDLWSTHDGGATWRHDVIAALPNARIVSVAVAAGNAYAAIYGVPNPPVATPAIGIAAAAEATDVWSPASVAIEPGAGPVPSTQLVLAGGDGWLLQVDRVVGAGVRLQDRKWTGWDTTGLTDSGGSCRLAAASATRLFAACDADTWVGAVGIWSEYQRAGRYLAVSNDGGTTFQPWGQPPPSGTFGPIAAAGSAVFVAGQGGSLFATFDAGQTWQPVVNAAGADAAVQQVTFFGSSLGAAIVRSGDVSTGGPMSTLYLTHDGGHTWKAVQFNGG